MNFENKPIFFKPKPLSANKELMAKLLTKRFNMIDAYRPNEKDFSDIYSEEEIKRDIKSIEELELIWKNYNNEQKYITDISKIYEGVITDQIEANAWFGDNCEVIPTSKYDDFKNGIDAVGIFDQDESKQYLGIGMDVTFASNKKILEDKLDSIKKCIKNGNLPKLKYFQDPQTKEHKKIFLPKVIVGSRLSSAEKLIQLWGGDDDNKNKKLKEHPVSSKLILESIFQLEYFYNYALGLSKNTKEDDLKKRYENIAREYGRMYNIFHDIYESRKILIESHLNEISDDIVYETILEYTGNK